MISLLKLVVDEKSFILPKKLPNFFIPISEVDFKFRFERDFEIGKNDSVALLVINFSFSAQFKLSTELNEPFDKFFNSFCFSFVFLMCSSTTNGFSNR